MGEKTPPNFFDRIRDVLTQGAAVSTSRIEEAARSGKLQLDIVAEKRKLTTRQSELGALTFRAAEEGQLSGLATQAPFLVALGQVRESHAEIAEMEERLAELHASYHQTEQGFGGSGNSGPDASHGDSTGSGI
jgi:hypothetical protein